MPYVILSPDGLPVRPEPFETLPEAEGYLDGWIENYKPQGYYAAANGERVSLDELRDYCDIVESEEVPVSDRDQRIIDLAKEEHHEEGKCEIDDTAEVSEGDDNGAYVQAWVWVDFSGTDLDKEKEEG